ncbi:hypothetical protein EXIGLDRAFT_708433 [Exidia glandulosa HHB12029]|uniref:Zn(2)-C6 fungal-type domain-containing protein n=1 Tax=Exidia glandulosa HHB12029 TaxID=1314781 RepID=A0A166N5I1_EXIGL|nr:hypothetical protein EXIGLDRAFT_708433 [Exidia glandulosa HHB12029]
MTMPTDAPLLVSQILYDANPSLWEKTARESAGQIILPPNRAPASSVQNPLPAVTSLETPSTIITPNVTSDTTEAGVLEQSLRLCQDVGLLVKDATSDATARQDWVSNAKSLVVGFVPPPPILFANGTEGPALCAPRKTVLGESDTDCLHAFNALRKDAALQPRTARCKTCCDRRRRTVACLSTSSETACLNCKERNSQCDNLSSTSASVRTKTAASTSSNTAARPTLRPVALSREDAVGHPRPAQSSSNDSDSGDMLIRDTPADHVRIISVGDVEVELDVQVDLEKLAAAKGCLLQALTSHCESLTHEAIRAFRTPLTFLALKPGLAPQQYDPDKAYEPSLLPVVLLLVAEPADPLHK